MPTRSTLYRLASAIELITGITLGSQDRSGGAAVWAGALIHVILGGLMIRDQFAHASG